MAEPMTDAAVQAATGKTWQEWTDFLDAAGARDMTHKQIADWLYEGKHIESGWWCQSVTVGYEQRIGRRVVGQKCDGSFAASASRTLDGNMDGVLDTWVRHVQDVTEFNGVPFDGEPKLTSTPKWRYWRVNLADGSRVTINISQKNEARALLAVEHISLLDKASSDEWKSFWRGFLGEV